MLPQARASSAVRGQGGEQVPGAELGGDEFVPALKVIGEFPDGVEGEFIGGYAGPFTLLVIADLLGVPEQDRQEFADHLQARPGSGHTIGGAGQAMTHNPLEFLYVKFATYIEDRRREPRDDVLTGPAAATFPGGSVPEVGDVVRVAANLFSAGQETTVRLLSTALKIMAERPGLQRLLRAERDRIPNFIEETLRLESPVKGDFRLSRTPVSVGGVRYRPGPPSWC